MVVVSFYFIEQVKRLATYVQKWVSYSRLILKIFTETSFTNQPHWLA